MQVQKRKLIQIIGAVLILFAMSRYLLAKELEILQYQNFKFLGKFHGGPALPDAYLPEALTREEADSALKEVSSLLLKKSQAADSEIFKQIVFGFELYFVQLSKIKVGDRSLIVFNAYKQGPGCEHPSKEWVVVDGGGADYFGGSIDDQTNKITISINDPF